MTYVKKSNGSSRKECSAPPKNPVTGVILTSAVLTCTVTRVCPCVRMPWLFWLRLVSEPLVCCTWWGVGKKLVKSSWSVATRRPLACTSYSRPGVFSVGQNSMCCGKKWEDTNIRQSRRPSSTWLLWSRNRQAVSAVQPSSVVCWLYRSNRPESRRQ